MESNTLTPDDFVSDEDFERWSEDRDDPSISRGEDEDCKEGCCYPGECCMPGIHLRSECHTAAMMVDQEREDTKGRKWTNRNY